MGTSSTSSTKRLGASQAWWPTEDESNEEAGRQGEAAGHEVAVDILSEAGEEERVPEKGMRDLRKKDLGLKSYVKVKSQSLMMRQKESRLKRSKELRNYVWQQDRASYLTSAIVRTYLERNLERGLLVDGDDLVDCALTVVDGVDPEQSGEERL